MTSKWNIGHLTGVTVNTAEKLVKEQAPAAKDATQGRFRSLKDSVKAEYKKARQGEEDPRMQEPIYARAIELTTGGK